MSTVKLTADSGGGTVALAGPSTTTGNAAVTLTLPGTASGTLATTAGIAVKEQFFTPCDGSTIATGAGNITIVNVTAEQAGSNADWADLTGSNITYTPPSGTTQVIYEFHFHYREVDVWNIAHFRLSIGGTEVTDARTTYACKERLIGRFCIKWAFNIGGSTTAATGRQATWTSGKEIKIEYKDYGSGHNSKAHNSGYWDQGSGVVVRPCIGITAIGGTA